MAHFYGIKDLASVADWQANAKREHWVRGHSAYELAHHWCGALRFPPRVEQVLAPLGGLFPKYGFVEFPTFLDTANAPSRTDLMLYCRSAADEPVVIGVEGKSAERFDKPVKDWVRKGEQNPTPSRSRRLKYLSELLGVEISSEAEFGYQLVHRSAATVSECMVQGAAFGVVLIHSFSTATPENWSDFQAFTNAVGLSIVEKDTLSKPVLLGPKRDVKMHFGWVSDRPSDDEGSPGE